MTIKICVLTSTSTVVGSLISFAEVFTYCRMYRSYKNKGDKQELFSSHFISLDGQPIQANENVYIKTSPLHEHENADYFDALVIPSFFFYTSEDLQVYLQEFEPFHDFIKSFMLTEKPICSYCTGSLLLASTGLLNGRSATCSWWANSTFKKVFPNVNLSIEKIVAKDERFITAGAASANFSLALTLIEYFYGKELSGTISKFLLIDPNRGGQSPYLDISATKANKDTLIKKIQTWMPENLDKNVKNISQEFHISERNLLRRFKKATGESPSQYMQKLKIEAAKKMLESTNLQIEEIAHEVKYEDISAFRKSFTKYTSISPREYRERFNTSFAR